MASIKLVRSDLLSDREVVAAPIPEQPPIGYFDKDKRAIAGVGEPMLATFIQKSHDTTSWLVFFVFITLFSTQLSFSQLPQWSGGGSTNTFFRDSPNFKESWLVEFFESCGGRVELKESRLLLALLLYVSLASSIVSVSIPSCLRSSMPCLYLSLSLCLSLCLCPFSVSVSSLVWLFFCHSVSLSLFSVLCTPSSVFSLSSVFFSL